MLYRLVGLGKAKDQERFVEAPGPQEALGCIVHFEGADRGWQVLRHLHPPTGQVTYWKEQHGRRDTYRVLVDIEKLRGVDFKGLSIEAVKDKRLDSDAIRCIKDNEVSVEPRVVLKVAEMDTAGMLAGLTGCKAYDAIRAVGKYIGESGHINDRGQVVQALIACMPRLGVYPLKMSMEELMVLTNALRSEMSSAAISTAMFGTSPDSIKKLDGLMQKIIGLVEGSV